MDNDYFVKFNCPEFTSLCPITGQPDFFVSYFKKVWAMSNFRIRQMPRKSTGHPNLLSVIYFFGIHYISYVPDRKMVESKSLKLYLFSYRNHGDFLLFRPKVNIFCPISYPISLSHTSRRYGQCRIFGYVRCPVETVSLFLQKSWRFS